MRSASWIIAIVIASAFQVSRVHAQSTEICGNAQDDNDNGRTDEYCYPTLTTNQCESPLSCEDTGMVSPVTGSLRYSLPPDVAPAVPFGPGIGLRRFYTSMYAPSIDAPRYRRPLGERWQHTYMTWIDRFTTLKRTPPDCRFFPQPYCDPSTTSVGEVPTHLVIHTNRGQDVRAAYGNTTDGWENYHPVTGSHNSLPVQYVRKRVAAPGEYQVKLLSGDMMVYSSNGQLIELWDTLVTPNKVVLTYDSNAQLSTVTDANGKRRLLFAYDAAGVRLTSVSFQLLTAGAWATHHVTTYGYTVGTLSTVTIGGELAQNNIYDASGLLSAIHDGEGKTIVGFGYQLGGGGRVSRVETARGVIGYELKSARAECLAKTVLYFNRGKDASCDLDADCGSGFLCGGKTGPGATGTCFRAARCLEVDASYDAVVKSVTALGPPGETCSGACLDATSYIWAATHLLQAVGDATGAYVTKEYNFFGLPTRITYGDSDTNPSNGNGAREVFLFYDATFPGKISEIRRKGSLATGTCSATIPTGCARTQYLYTSNGLLARTIQIGAVPEFYYETNYTYADARGRLTRIDGPLPGTTDETLFAYHTASDPLLDGFLNTVTQRISATTTLTTSAPFYDFWGNPTTLKDADDTLSCQTFSAARGHLVARRELMSGQTSCTAFNATTDLETTWQRDSAQRLVRMQRPDGSCMLYEYDKSGRLERTKRRDDCNAASNGDREEYIYDSDGLLTKIETFDETNAVARRREMTYFDSRRLERVLNPVNPAKWTGLGYDGRGLLTELDGAGLSKTRWDIDADRRITAERRYRTSTVFDTWDLFYDWLGNQRLVTDDDHIAVGTDRDDLGRVVEIESPDLGSYPTKQVWDEASRLTSVRESAGGPGEQLHAFSFDAIGRPLNDDYAGQCGSTNTADTKRTYDAAPSACPAGATCTNVKGRLAYVKTTLLCSTAYADGALDQETFYGYDAAGRVVSEYIRDDAGRVAAHEYQWTKNGELKQVKLPSTAIIGWSHGSANSNSDTDRVSAIWRTSTATPIIDNVLWNAYGPLKQYNQQNLASSPAVPLRTRIVRNLAYRVTQMRVETASGGLQFGINRTEDDKGRTTSRTLVNPVAGAQSSFYKYDMQDRLTCETTVNGGSCASGSTTIKNSHSMSPPFTPAGDWKRILRPGLGYSQVVDSFAISAGTHRLSRVDQSYTTEPVGSTEYVYDSRGNRASELNAIFGTSRPRTYTYDGRRNVRTVSVRIADPIIDGDLVVTSAYDASNRRVFKSVADPTTGTMKTSHWFFYYDALDRLSEVHHVPDTSNSGTKSVYQLFWINDRIVLYWQTDYPSGSSSRRYVATDEMNRPVEMACWGTGANCPRVWAIDPSAWGVDSVIIGADSYQPIVFAGQYRDVETELRGGSGQPARPALSLNGYRTYDPFVGAYLQPDPMLDMSISTYGYAESNPVDKLDPLGLMTQICGEIYDDEFTEDGVVYQDCWDTTGGGSSGTGGSTGGGGGGGGGAGPASTPGTPQSPRPPKRRPRQPPAPLDTRWWGSHEALQAIRSYFECQKSCAQTQCDKPGGGICNCHCSPPGPPPPPPPLQEPTSCPPGFTLTVTPRGTKRCIQLLPSTSTTCPVPFLCP